MPDADETIITRFLVEAEEAIEETAKFRAQIETIKTQIIETAKATKESFDVVATSIKRTKIEEFTNDINILKNTIKELQSQKVLTADEQANLVAYKSLLREINKDMREFKEATSRALTEVKRGEGGLQGFIASLGNLGNIGKYVFGTILGIGAVQAVRQLAREFVDFAKEILQRAEEMSNIIFTFEVAIRGLQRVGLDTTIEGWTERIQELKKEFPFFPKREFIEAASLAALMTREFGFTEEQIAAIVRQSAILSQITGKDLYESVRAITYAIGSGYFESLQRAGINISRQVVANEALAQGYKGVYTELEPTIRAQLTYSVITKNLAAIQEDASQKVNTYAGQVQILQATLEDLKNLFGEVVSKSTTAMEALRDFNETLVQIKDTYTAISKLNIDVFVPIKEVLDTLIAFPRIQKDIELITTNLRGLVNILGALQPLAEYFGLTDLAEILGVFNKLSQSLGELETKAQSLARYKVGDIFFTKEDYEEIMNATEDLQKELAEIEEDYFKRRDDIFQDYQRDVERNAEQHYQKLEDLAEDHQQRLDDIELKASQRRADAIADYEFRVAEALRDAVFRRAEAERKYREREIREEKRFQEKLRQLRENFLLDLEDAVRERDARQIIRLTRQYNLRRTQMVREEKLSKDDRQAAFDEELRQIEFQRQERLRQLAVEHQRRLQEIDLQAERERAREAVEFQRRQEAENARWDQQKADRNERLGEQLTDLDKATSDRVSKVLQGIQEEYELTKQQLDAVEELWKSYYGPDGRLIGWVDYGIQATIDRMNRFVEWQNALLAQMFAGRSITPRVGGGYGYAGEQAEGGTIIARKPTVAIFGESGPEMAQFTPLNRLGANAPAQITPTAVDQLGRDGRIRLEMLLSPDLEARILDNTLGEIADINFSIERARK